jgi:hypothetical protein
MSKSTSRRPCAGLRRLIVTRFLPGGVRFGRSGYLARRRQTRVGGERPRFINCDLATGRWYDFVVERRGVGLLSLTAHNPQFIAASRWLDENKPVEQMTWAPGEPQLIRDRLITGGGWIKRPPSRGRDFSRRR